MDTRGKRVNIKRWSAAWVLAVAFHLAIVGIIAWRLIPDETVRVSGMVPAPDQTVELIPAQGIEPALFFSSKPSYLNPDAAKLYRIEEDGSKTLISSGRHHPKREFGLQFDAVSEPGQYEIVVEDGESGVVREPNVFDGEFAGVFPSGNGTPGGVFSAQFRIEAKTHEIMTATMYDPDKPMENEEPAAKAELQPKVEHPIQKIAQPRKQEAPKPKLTNPEPPKPVPTRQKTKTSTVPQNENVAEAIGPIESSPVVDHNEPSPVAVTPEMLRVSPVNFAPTLTAESAQIAAANFAELDTNKFVAAADLAKKRSESAYGKGPVIGTGQQGNSLAHLKDVSEYLALMHKEIHPLWAEGYLLRLDTIYRQRNARTNDRDIEAVVEITLDSLGNVSDVRIVRSSGSTDYDNEAIHVAWESSPKLPIPEEMRSPNGKAYVHWTFWRDQRQCGVFGVKVFKLNNNSRDALNFSLKAVQLQEKKLGLKPSVLSIPGGNIIKTTPTPEPSHSEEQQKESLPERINPLDD